LQTQNFGGGELVIFFPSVFLSHPHPSSICHSQLASLQHFHPSRKVAGKKVSSFFLRSLSGLFNPNLSTRLYPVWTLEALRLLRVSTQKFWIIGKLTAPSPSLRGNTWDTTNPPSGIPAKNQASAPMSPTWAPFMTR
jgi:hypothetical protein